MKDLHDRNDADDLEQVDDIQTEPELEDIEENSTGKLKKLQAKLKEVDTQKREILEELQRAKAEFLNAKRRLEEERTRDRERSVNDLIEKLLPLCDSFYMAKSDAQAWEAIDPTWRKGVESIYTQLQSILATYNVTELDPEGEDFDPNLHEAVANVPVTDKKAHHKVINVVQNGFVRKTGSTETLIRPARVTVGEFNEV